MNLPPELRCPNHHQPLTAGASELACPDGCTIPIINNIPRFVSTDNYADAWFCGYTPNLAACVWVGYPRGEIAMNLGGPIPGPAFGGGYPATIWRVFAQQVFADEAAKFPPTAWPVPHHFITFKPWHSPNFTLPPPTPTTKKGKPTSGTGGGGSGGGGGGSTGGTSTGGPPTSTR